MTKTIDKDSYRIGQYAQKMGVTPDFLKYYEQVGLLNCQTSENGYRYYRFGESYKILECMRLKNYGFSVREREALLGENMEQLQMKMDEQIRAMEQKVAFEQRVIAAHHDFQDWLCRMDGKSADWSIGWSQEMLFLPHTSRRNFLDDPRIYEILKDWINNMPIVRSCMKIQPPLTLPFRPETSDFVWGLIVPQRIAGEIALPVNDAVVPLPRKKIFQYSFINQNHSSPMPVDDAMEKLRQMGLQPAGNICVTIFMYANIRHNSQRCGMISIPIAE